MTTLDDIQTAHSSGADSDAPTPKPLALSLGDYTAEAYETAQGIRWRVRHIGDLEEHYMVPVLGDDGQQKLTKSGDLRWRQRVTRGARTTLSTSEPLNEVRAWMLMLRKQEEHVDSFAIAQRLNRQDDLTSIRDMVTELLPDVNYHLHIVEQVRELAQALSGERRGREEERGEARDQLRAAHSHRDADRREVRLAMASGITKALGLSLEDILGSRPYDGTEANYGALLGARIKEALSVSSGQPPPFSGAWLDDIDKSMDAAAADERFLKVDPEADNTLSREQRIAILTALTDETCDHTDILPPHLRGWIFADGYDREQLYADAELAWGSPDNPITLALVDAEASAVSASMGRQLLRERGLAAALEGEADEDDHHLIREVAALVRTNNERAAEVEQVRYHVRRAEAKALALSMLFTRESSSPAARHVALWVENSEIAPSALITEEVERLLNLLGQEPASGITRRISGAMTNLLADANEVSQPSTVRSCGPLSASVGGAA